MAGQFTADAEVAHRADEAGAEHLLPEAVDRDAGRQRMLRPQEPLREAEAAFRQIGGERREGGGRLGRHRVAALVVLTAEEDVCRWRLPALLHDVRDRAPPL